MTFLAGMLAGAALVIVWAMLSARRAERAAREHGAGAAPPSRRAGKG